MKRVGLYILFFASYICSAQVAKMPADTEFFYTYGGVNFDEGRDIKETRDKGYILVGTTSSFGQGNTSVYIIKTDSLGNHKWSSVQGGTQNDWGYFIDTTYDGGFFAAGYSNSFSSDYYYGAYYLKTDANGNLLWQKFIDNGANSFIYGACHMPDSGYVLCGQTYATTAGTADAYLIRVDKNGNTLWTNHYGDSLDEVFNSVCIINNKIYAVGSSGSHAGADSLADGWIMKLDMNGNKLQDAFVSYGGHQQETLNGITPYNANQFHVCGGNIHIDSNATTGIIIRYDTSLSIIENMTTLNVLGSSYFTAPGAYISFNKIVNISYGSITVIGAAKGGLGGTNMFFMGFSSGGWLLYDGAGAAYIHHSGGINNDYGYSGIYTSAGRVIGVGSAYNIGETPNYCSNPKTGLEDVFLVRFNSDSIYNNYISTTQTNCFADTLFLWQASIKNYTSNFKASLFPNPASANATLAITSANNEQYNAKVFSVLGTEVNSFKVNSNQSNPLDLSLLSEGAYFLKVQDTNEQTISVLKFIITR